MPNIYDHPQDVLRPIAVILEAVMHITLDPEATELANSLIEYAHELADSHCLKRRDADEVARG
ncbi:hypothetical protein SODG_003745 [Sodalis praecaptivus]|uniref:hypothetical protein n=1 Tax=Sodalis praecaptivus TaxID=1239307 RepID=UPI0027EC75C2|nr:hypothetical protein [Sodalis praecaptivus]CAJ0995606.1 hypothetical protein NVIRENTERO_01988 [Sodalis praecaptivus]